MVVRQASMVSFVTLFRAMAILFLIMIPLVMLMKRPAKGAAAAPAH
jgi:predicted ABC-type exoprotein transport system permease subunit